jgi:hypothetical protein
MLERIQIRSGAGLEPLLEAGCITTCTWHPVALSCQSVSQSVSQSVQAHLQAHDGSVLHCRLNQQCRVFLCSSMASNSSILPCEVCVLYACLRSSLVSKSAAGWDH